MQNLTPFSADVRLYLWNCTKCFLAGRCSRARENWRVFEHKSTKFTSQHSHRRRSRFSALYVPFSKKIQTVFFFLGVVFVMRYIFAMDILRVLLSVVDHSFLFAQVMYESMTKAR